MARTEITSAGHIFEEMKQKALSCRKMSFVKESVLLSVESFTKFSSLFLYDLGPEKGMRTGENFLHLHANPKKEHVEVHMDHGNVAKNVFLGIFHFLIDVVPYRIFCLTKHRVWHVSAESAHRSR